MPGVLPPPPPPPLLPELPLSSPPQAPTPRASAPMRQPVAANQREFKEPLLIKGCSLGGDCTHAAFRPTNRVPRSAADCVVVANRWVRGGGQDSRRLPGRYGTSRRAAAATISISSVS